MKTKDIMMIAAYGLLCLGAVAAQLAVLWVVCSLVFSGFKSATDQCGQDLAVDTVLAGDWLCPKKP